MSLLAEHRDGPINVTVTRHPHLRHCGMLIQSSVQSEMRLDYGKRFYLQQRWPRKTRAGESLDAKSVDKGHYSSVEFS